MDCGLSAFAGLMLVEAAVILVVVASKLSTSVELPWLSLRASRMMVNTVESKQQKLTHGLWTVICQTNACRGSNE